MRKIAINTLAFSDVMTIGLTKQEQYFEYIASENIAIAEVRREYFSQPELECEKIKREAEKHKLEIYYSVPEKIYVDGVLDKPNLKKYADEAKTLGARRVKLIIGEFNKMTLEDADWLVEYFNDNGIKISVENDQTDENGRINKILLFLSNCKMYKELQMDMTFDIGNWIYAKENPEEAALTLAPFVGFIHLKDVKKTVPYETCFLGEGDIDLSQIIEMLPQDVPLAIEYPCGIEVAKNISEEIKKINLSL